MSQLPTLFRTAAEARRGDSLLIQFQYFGDNCNLRKRSHTSVPEATAGFARLCGFSRYRRAAQRKPKASCGWCCLATKKAKKSSSEACGATKCLSNDTSMGTLAIPAMRFKCEGIHVIKLP